MLVLVQGLSVDGWDVSAARVPVGKTRDVGSEGSVRETSFAVRGLGSMAETVSRSTGAALADGSLDFLHPE